MTHINLSGAFSKAVEVNGWAVDYSGDSYAAWRKSKTAVAFDAISLVFRSRAAAERFAAAHASQVGTRAPIRAIRPVYWVSGNDGFVIHEVSED